MRMVDFRFTSAHGLKFKHKMASRSGGKRLSKQEMKKLQAERGKKGAVARGLGFGSRQEFVLPAQWTTEEHETSSKRRKIILSPGKNKYHNFQHVKDTIKERGLDLCFLNSSESSQSEGEASGCEENSTKLKLATEKMKKEALPVERRLFVCESTQLTKFVDGINETSKCATSECNGECGFLFAHIFS